MARKRRNKRITKPTGIKDSGELLGVEIASPFVSGTLQAAPHSPDKIEDLGMVHEEHGVMSGSIIGVKSGEISLDPKEHLGISFTSPKTSIEVDDESAIMEEPFRYSGTAEKNELTSTVRIRRPPSLAAVDEVTPRPQGRKRNVQEIVVGTAAGRGETAGSDRLPSNASAPQGDQHAARDANSLQAARRRQRERKNTDPSRAASGAVPVMAPVFAPSSKAAAPVKGIGNREVSGEIALHKLKTDFEKEKSERTAPLVQEPRQIGDGAEIEEMLKEDSQRRERLREELKNAISQLPSPFALVSRVEKVKEERPGAGYVSYDPSKDIRGSSPLAGGTISLGNTGELAAPIVEKTGTIVISEDLAPSSGEIKPEPSGPVHSQSAQIPEATSVPPKAQDVEKSAKKTKRRKKRKGAGLGDDPGTPKSPVPEAKSELPPPPDATPQPPPPPDANPEPPPPSEAKPEPSPPPAARPEPSTGALDAPASTEVTKEEPAPTAEAMTSSGAPVSSGQQEQRRGPRKDAPAAAGKAATPLIASPPLTESLPSAAEQGNIRALSADGDVPHKGFSDLEEEFFQSEIKPENDYSGLEDIFGKIEAEQSTKKSFFSSLKNLFLADSSTRRPTTSRRTMSQKGMQSLEPPKEKESDTPSQGGKGEPSSLDASDPAAQNEKAGQELAPAQAARNSSTSTQKPTATAAQKPPRKGTTTRRRRRR